MQENYSLKKYNTFGIEAHAKQFATFTSVHELITLLTPDSLLPTLILGGGSNILFTANYNGLVLKNEIGGIEKISEDEDYVYIKAGAGENWHSFVLYCIENDYAGIENLSLIPGNVGASPMQNIGAYGVEIKDVFHSLEAYHLKDQVLVRFTKEDCEFGYRESVFKRKYKDHFAITSVNYRLSKKPVFNTSYGAIGQELERMGVKELSIKAISDAVIRIRQSKLPDPKEIGNAGSFFKNPIVSVDHLQKLQQQYPGIPHYSVTNSLLTTHYSLSKLAAGWLIEQCGWKGYRKGDAGCHAKQALVLVNYGNASGQEICDLSNEIIQSVQNKFGVQLEREVNII